MSSDSEISSTYVFFVYGAIFCLITWIFGMSYVMLEGPTAMATVVGKHPYGSKRISYYLNIRHEPPNRKVMDSELEVEKEHYTNFALGDKFPIHYARTFPNSTDFVGKKFY